MVADEPLNTGRAMRDAIASDPVRLEDYDLTVGTDTSLRRYLKRLGRRADGPQR